MINTDQVSIKMSSESTESSETEDLVHRQKKWEGRVVKDWSEPIFSTGAIGGVVFIAIGFFSESVVTWVSGGLLSGFSLLGCCLVRRYKTRYVIAKYAHDIEKTSQGLEKIQKDFQVVNEELVKKTDELSQIRLQFSQANELFSQSIKEAEFLREKLEEENRGFQKKIFNLGVQLETFKGLVGKIGKEVQMFDENNLFLEKEVSEMDEHTGELEGAIEKIGNYLGHFLEYYKKLKAEQVGIAKEVEKLQKERLILFSEIEEFATLNKEVRQGARSVELGSLKLKMTEEELARTRHELEMVNFKFEQIQKELSNSVVKISSMMELANKRRIGEKLLVAIEGLMKKLEGWEAESSLESFDLSIEELLQLLKRMLEVNSSLKEI